MKKIFCLLSIIAMSHSLLAQTNPVSVYYVLADKPGGIKIYQNIPKSGNETSDRPDTTIFNFWNFAKKTNYHFKTDISYTFTDNKKKFYRIRIPAGYRWDPYNKIFISDPDRLANYDNPKKWDKSGDNVDSQDFNSWLWVSEEDFNGKMPYYQLFQGNFVLSGIVTPLKYRFATGGHATSLLNGDVNLGTLIGWRFVNNIGTAGLSLGIFGGVSSLPMNSSNNTNDTFKASSSSSTSGSSSATSTSTNNTGLNYGGAFVVDVSNKFQLGLVAGWDHAVGDLSKGYIYQDKIWLGFSLNFKFLDFGSNGKDTQNGLAKEASTKSKSTANSGN